MRGTTAHTQPKVVLSDATSLWWLSPTKNVRDRSVPSRDIDDQKILQGDWTRSTTTHTHPKKVVPDATFRDHWIPYKDTDDWRILESEWLRA